MTKVRRRKSSIVWRRFLPFPRHESNTADPIRHRETCLSQCEKGHAAQQITLVMMGVGDAALHKPL
jgi:hypothetical protein